MTASRSFWAPQNDQFPTGFIRVSASGAKVWEMIDFTQVLPRFWHALWALLTKLAWRTFNLDYVLVGFQRFSVNAFLSNRNRAKFNLDLQIKGFPIFFEKGGSATRSPYKPNAFSLFSVPFWQVVVEILHKRYVL